MVDDQTPRHNTFIATGVDDQYAHAQDDPARILIVGAGVAGLTLAQLLRGRGWHPVLIERVGHERDFAGYMLGLMPFVDSAISELGAEASYLANSTGMQRYVLRGAHGQLLKSYGFDAVTEYGHYRGIDRSELMRVLAGGHAPVAYGTTVTALHDTSATANEGPIDAAQSTTPGTAGGTTGTVEVALHENGKAHRLDFDAVIVADGLHSSTRNMVIDAGDISYHDTGWGGWVVWDDDTTDVETYVETWGAGFFLGLYPVPGRTGVFLGAPHEATQQGPGALASAVQDRIPAPDPRTGRALHAVAASQDPFFWSFADVRCARWTVGRATLLGDAAAGFLPTAGVGASMAIESAHALAGRLIEAGNTNGAGSRGMVATPVQPGDMAARIPDALRAYEAEQRPRVERAQRNSRKLADLMFRGGGPKTSARDAAARFIGVRTALRPTLALLKSRSRPAAV